MANGKSGIVNNRVAGRADLIIDGAVYSALCAVFIDGAYCQKAITDVLKLLRDERSYPFVTSAFYGVLDNNVRFEKLISLLCDKPPTQNAAVLLKLGLFYLRCADMPDYAAVNRVVELSKQQTGIYSGFINAVLKRSIGFEPTFRNGLERFTYDHNAPEWLCKALISDYSETRAASILDAVVPQKTHIRPIKDKITPEQFCSLAGKCERTPYGCYCDKKELARFPDGTVTAQALSSVLAVNAYAKGISGGKALDLCAAPGGKSVYLYELGKFDITSCDIYPHKIELIKKLAKKTGVRLKTVLNDATVNNDGFVDKFDIVIADCPCSGTGTVKTKPDVLLRRTPANVAELCVTQKRILDVAARYPVIGGVLCYSTCSILKCENEKIRDAFLAAHPDYELLDETKLLPDTDHCDGFYIVRFRRRAR